MGNKPKDLTGYLYFSDNAPHVIGHLTIGRHHYELAGIRRTPRKTDFTGRRQCAEPEQSDLFEDHRTEREHG